MAQQLLYEFDVCTGFMQVRSEAMSQTMEGYGLLDFSGLFGPMENTLQTARTVRFTCVLSVEMGWSGYGGQSFS